MTPPALRERFDLALRGFLADVLPKLPVIADELRPLGNALEAFVLDGGKRLRPSFCYWGYRATGAPDGPEIVPAAAALELLQACALMHDDVIDDSATRRGAPAVHRRFAALHRDEQWRGDPERFGQAAAILLGDLALIWADAMLAGSGFEPDSFQRAAEVWEAMRVEVMCGQYLDVVEQARGGGSVERALRVARYKSAKYTIERPLQLGVSLATGRPTGQPAGQPTGRRELRAGFSLFGLPLGEAFQLRDDVLGVYGDPATTGKPAGDDLREGKRTVLVAFAVEAASEPQRVQLDRLVGDPDLDDAGVAVLRDVIEATGALSRIEALIAARVDEALQALARLDIDAEARAALVALARESSQRAG